MPNMAPSARSSDVGMLEKAGPAADALLKRTLTTADPVMRSLAWDAVARVAEAREDLPRALECAGRAIAELPEHGGLPDTTWRAHATSARIHARAGDRETAAGHCDKAVSVLRAAAQSFDEGDPFRRSLIAAAEVLRGSLQ